jgi:hypothetical protein
MKKDEIKQELERVLLKLERIQLNYTEYSRESDECITEAMAYINDAIGDL